jgi:hypothetical protein
MEDRNGGTGHTGAVLLHQIREVAAGSMVLAPDDPDAERDNTWWLSATPQERLGVSVEEVVTAFEETARRVAQRVKEMPYDGPATFYVWHHQEAGQLRCSTSSTQPTSLPFDDEYFPTHDLSTIVTEFLSDGEPGFVRFPGFKAVDFGVSQQSAPAFPVWTYDVSTEVADGAA